MPVSPVLLYYCRQGLAASSGDLHPDLSPNLSTCDHQKSRRNTGKHQRFTSQKHRLPLPARKTKTKTKKQKVCRLGSSPGVVTFGQRALTHLSTGVPTYKIYFYGNVHSVSVRQLRFNCFYGIMYHTVTSNHGNLAFCTVIFCTVMVNVLYYGNGRHGVGKYGLSR